MANLKMGYCPDSMEAWKGFLKRFKGCLIRFTVEWSGIDQNALRWLVNGLALAFQVEGRGAIGLW